MTDTNNYRRFTIDDISYEGCINVLEVFLSNIAAEFESAYHHHMNNPRDKKSKELFDKIYNYISSEDFSQLTTLDGKYIADLLLEKFSLGKCG